MSRNNASQTAKVLTMTSDEKKLLDTFLRDVFWESEQGFCRKLPVGHGVRAIALRSRTNVMDLLQSIVTIRQACLSLMYPKVPLQELLFRELDTNQSTACYEYMFDQWLADDSRWREEQGAFQRVHEARLRREAFRARDLSSGLVMAA